MFHRGLVVAFTERLRCGSEGLKCRAGSIPWSDTRHILDDPVGEIDRSPLEITTLLCALGLVLLRPASEWEAWFRELLEAGRVARVETPGGGAWGKQLS